MISWKPERKKRFPNRRVSERGPGRQFGDLVRFMKIDQRREAIR